VVGIDDVVADLEVTNGCFYLEVGVEYLIYVNCLSYFGNRLLLS
jgi:hypothetical protein